MEFLPVFFSTEADLFREMCITLGLPEKESGKWTRHPLSYLVEAADDICYSILDVEDAIELGILQFGDVRNMFEYLCGANVDIDKEFVENGQNFRDFLSSIRGLAIQNLIDDIADVFTKYYAEIMNGDLDKSLISLSKNRIPSKVFVLARGSAKSAFTRIAVKRNWKWVAILRLVRC